MRRPNFIVLSLLCVLPAVALAKDDGFTSDEEVLYGPKDDPSKPARPKAKKKKGAESTEVAPGPVAVVLLPKDPGANEAAAALEERLSAAFAADGRIPPVDTLAALGGEPEAAPMKPTVAEHFKKGKEAYDNLDLGVAATEYLEGVRLMNEDPASVQPSAVARALTLAGAAHLLNGENPKAAALFKRAHVISPAYSPDANEFSPDILTGFNEAKAAVASGPKANFTITSNATPALVFVDGTELGAAPATLKDLAVGMHHVLVKSRGHAPYAAFVNVGGEKGVGTLNAELKTLPEADRFRKGMEIASTELNSSKVGFGAQELASALKARYVVFGVASSASTGAQVELVAYDVGTMRRVLGVKKNVLPGSPSFDTDSRAITAQILDGLLKNRKLVVEEEKAVPPVYERGWFWPVVGVVGGVLVAGAVTGAVLGVNASQKPGTPGILITGVP